MSQTEVGQSVFVARQPILDGDQDTHAYELLFRSGLENCCRAVDGDTATLDVIAHTFLEIGMDELTSGKPCFINFTRKLLLEKTPHLLPPELVTVEILENVEPDRDVCAACRELTDAGYTLALDDFVLADCGHPLLDVVGIVKVDFMGTSPDERVHIMEDLLRRGIRGLAEKVETRQEFEDARQAGYSYFQGYFFSKPVIKEGKALSGNSLAHLQLLQEVHRPELSFERLEETIKKDTALTYRLLRFINSAWFGLRHKVDSIRHALVLLGPPEIRKWFALVSLRGMAEGKPNELMIQALTRARMAEELAPDVGMQKAASDLFLMGMFSVLDALLDKPIGEILAKLPIHPQITSALLGEPGRFRDVLYVILAFERADWGAFASCAAGLGLCEDAVQPVFQHSVKWASDAFSLSA
ncbi:MAG TPA: HDOD domain-containing protein [Phycisphaerae bacterium]|nr:HDOD domain-containing protein [Phycisphaerae bacterium]